MCAREAITYSRDRHIEREAVVDERNLLRDALRRSMGTATFQQVRENLDERIRSGEFVQLDRGQNSSPASDHARDARLRARQHRLHEIRARKIRAAGLGTAPEGTSLQVHPPVEQTTPGCRRPLE